MNRKSLVLIATVLALTACQPNIPTPSLDNVTQQAPVAQGSDGYGAGTVAAAAIGGALVGNMLGKRSQPQHTIIQHAPSPVYGGGSYYGGGRKTVTTTTTRRSMFGGRTVTRTVTRRR